MNRIHVVHICGLCIPTPQGNATAYGVWWGNKRRLNLSERLQDEEDLNQAELEAVLTAIRQAKEQSYRKIMIKTSSDFIVNRFTNRNRRNNDEDTINMILQEMEHVEVDFKLVSIDEIREATELARKATKVRINKSLSNNLQQLQNILLLFCKHNFFSHIFCLHLFYSLLFFALYRKSRIIFYVIC